MRAPTSGAGSDLALRPAGGQLHMQRPTDDTCFARGTPHS